MLPSILAKQLEKGIGDYIETMFPMTNEPFKGSVVVPDSCVGFEGGDGKLLLVLGKLGGDLAEDGSYFLLECTGELVDVGAVEAEDVALFKLDFPEVVRVDERLYDLGHAADYKILPEHVHYRNP